MSKEFDEAVYKFCDCMFYHAKFDDCIEEDAAGALMGMKHALEKYKPFKPPIPEEVEEEGKGLGYDVDGEKFCEFYGSKGWMVGKTKMKNWVMALNRACKEGWCLRTKKKESPLEEMQRKQKEYLG